jgi:RNA polymerase sigma-70 factor, ECF subfamily
MRDVVSHVGRLRRYARSLCRDQNEADDIVQETLERALRGIEQFRQDGDLRVWLFGILHNVFISRTRAVARSNRHHNEIRSRSDAALLPSEEQSSDLRRVLALVEKLPVEQRQVLLLVSMEGFSTAEIADQLGLPVGTIRSRLARGREALRSACLSDEDRAAGRTGERGRSFRVVGGQDVKEH